MASNAESGTEGLQEDAFVKELIHDPTQPTPPFGVFEGLLGKSPRRGYWRLYLDSELTRSLEFKEEDILAAITIPKEQSQLGLEGTKLWLKRDATIVHTMTKQMKVGEFFEVPESSITPFGSLAKPVGGGGYETGLTCLQERDINMAVCDEKHPPKNDSPTNWNQQDRQNCYANADAIYRQCRFIRGEGGSFGGVYY